MPRSRPSASHTPAHQQLDPSRWWEFTNRLVSSSVRIPVLSFSAPPLAARPGRRARDLGERLQSSPIVAEYTEAQLDSACSTAEILGHAIDESFDFNSSSRRQLERTIILRTYQTYQPPISRLSPPFAISHTLVINVQTCSVSPAAAVHVVQTMHPQTLVRPILRKEEPLRTSSALFSH